jgi:hypothetical protein
MLPMKETIPYEQAMLRYHPNWFLRRLGFKRKEARGRYEFRWGSVELRYYFGLRFEVIQFSDDCDYNNLWSLDITPLWGRFWIELPKWLPRATFGESGQNDIRHWGFSWRWFDPDAGSAEIVLYWKDSSRYISLPWSLVHIRHQILGKDGQWYDDPGYQQEAERIAFEAKIAYDTYPYRYTLKSGVVQLVDAKICVSEREWRCKGWKRWRFFNRIKRTIEVQFSGEVGERAGSWKGGTLGCGMDIQLDETPHETLKRMECTRKF